MHALYNHSGELIAYQYQHALVHPENMQVLGLVLGNCVFDQKAKVLGKLFQQKIYNLSGEVLAYKAGQPLPIPENIDTNSIIQQTWNIVILIKDHSCAWVAAKTAWAPYSLAELIYAY
jgi:hypothetical protein